RADAALVRDGLGSRIRRFCNQLRTDPHEAAASVESVASLRGSTHDDARESGTLSLSVQRLPIISFLGVVFQNHAGRQLVHFTIELFACRLRRKALDGKLDPIGQFARKLAMPQLMLHESLDELLPTLPQ